MRTRILKAIAFTFCILFISNTAQSQNQHHSKSISEIISENDSSKENIPSDFTLDKQALIYAKRHAKKLNLDKSQTLRLTVKRLEYLQKLKKLNLSIYSDNSQKRKLENEYYRNFYSLLNPVQKKKILNTNNT